MSQSDDIKVEEFRWLAQWDRVLRATGSMCLYVGMALFVAMTTMTVIHVIGRYALDKPIKGQAELAIYMLITAVFLLITSTQLVKAHTVIGLIVDGLPKRTQAIIDIVLYLLCLAITALICWQCFLQADYIKEAARVTTILRIPLFPAYYVVAVGWGLISLVIIMQLVSLIITAVKK